MDEKELHEAAKKSTLNFNPMSPTKQPKNRRVTELVDLNPVDEYRRAWGTFQLCQCMMDKPQPGHAYHILTGISVSKTTQTEPSVSKWWERSVLHRGLMATERLHGGSL